MAYIKEQIMKSTIHAKKYRNICLADSALFLSLLLLTPTQVLAFNFDGSLNEMQISDVVGANQAPTAVIKYTQDGDTFTFDASGSNDPDGNIAEYKWDFGDGSQATGISVSHKYTDITSANVSLQILDNDTGATVSQQQIAISGSCQYQSSDVSSVSLRQLTPDIYSNFVYGQSFTPNSTGEIYSIKVNSYYIPDPSSATLMIRVGDTPDLSTTFEIEETFSLANYTSGDTIELVFTKKPSTTSGITKYFMIYNNNEDYNTRFKLYQNNISGYAEGTAYTSTTGLADVVPASGDLSFEVMVCD